MGGDEFPKWSLVVVAEWLAAQVPVLDKNLRWPQLVIRPKAPFHGCCPQMMRCQRGVFLLECLVHCDSRDPLEVTTIDLVHKVLRRCLEHLAIPNQNPNQYSYQPRGPILDHDFK